MSDSPLCLGIDTSNYTTSAAVFDGETVKAVGRIIPVKAGECGLRQSDALFTHVNVLPEVLAEVFTGDNTPITAIGVSSRPRNAEGSYMPCFLAGVSAGEMIKTVTGAPLYKTSHQVGHILAALYSVGKLSLVKETFAALHISGGTTDMLICKPHTDDIISCECIASSADLKAGQLVDRAGVMLGLAFPCGKALEELAKTVKGSDIMMRIKVPFKGGNPCFSGAENTCHKLLNDGVPDAVIARYVLDYIAEAVRGMIERNLPNGIKTVIFAGGVMSNGIIKRAFADDSRFLFSMPRFSSDNAAGTAIYAYLRDNKAI
jgi:N6-L-threonylcarbamoyladenine synthase